MPNFTKTLNLEKPLRGEFYSIETHNENSDKIDLAIEKITVPTIAHLQNMIELKVGDIVDIQGYYEAGDGAHHKRKIENEDDGSRIQLANGLWANIVHGGEVDVSWFGAKGDGVTDDTDAVQKAVLFSNVFIPAGLYKITSKINITSNRQVRGLGNSSELKIEMASNNPCFYLKDVKNVTVGNLSIRGTNVTDGQFINADLNFFGKNTGIITEGSLEDVIFENILFEKLDAQAISLRHTASYSSRLICDKIKIENCGYGLDVYLMCEYNNFTNFEINKCNVGYNDKSGNNNFTSSHVNYNYIGVFMQDLGNGGHGVISAVNCNHNNYRSFWLKDLRYGEVINAVTAFYGEFLIENCRGVTVSNSLFGTCKITIKNSPYQNSFIGCSFDDAIDFSSDSSSYTKVKNSTYTRITNLNGFHVVTPTDIKLNSKNGVAIGTAPRTLLTFNGASQGHYYHNQNISRALIHSSSGLAFVGANTLNVTSRLCFNTSAFGQSGINTVTAELIVRNSTDGNEKILDKQTVDYSVENSNVSLLLSATDSNFDHLSNKYWYGVVVTSSTGLILSQDSFLRVVEV